MQQYHLNGSKTSRKVIWEWKLSEEILYLANPLQRICRHVDERMVGWSISSQWSETAIKDMIITCEKQQLHDSNN